jgi:hypothetical protein
MTFHDTTCVAELSQIGDPMLADPEDFIPPLARSSVDDGVLVGACASRRTAVVLVLESGREMPEGIRSVCEFLDVAVEQIDGDADLLPFLRRYQPMAVIAAMDADGQDGGNALMAVARHDRSLPVLLITDEDPVLEGAADAVAELWGLTEVTQAADWPAPGTFVEFLCRAGQKGSCLALLPI